MVERRRAVALAYHFREAEGLSIKQIADRLGRSPATVKAYFYDPTGEKARAVKARYLGVCRGCGAYTRPRNGKGDAYRYCKACHPGAIEPRWTRELVLEAMREWRSRYGRQPSSYDWSGTHARRQKGNTLERLNEGDWPAASVVTKLFGSWAVARAANESRGGGAVDRSSNTSSPCGAISPAEQSCVKHAEATSRAANRDAAATTAHESRGCGVPGNERGSLRALCAAVRKGRAVWAAALGRTGLARSLGSRECAAGERRRIAFGCPRGKTCGEHARARSSKIPARMTVRSGMSRSRDAQRISHDSHHRPVRPP